MIAAGKHHCGRKNHDKLSSFLRWNGVHCIVEWAFKKLGWKRKKKPSCVLRRLLLVVQDLGGLFPGRGCWEYGTWVGMFCFQSCPTVWGISVFLADCRVGTLWQLAIFTCQHLQNGQMIVQTAWAKEGKARGYQPGLSSVPALPPALWGAASQPLLGHSATFLTPCIISHCSVGSFFLQLSLNSCVL